jgi:hypothetical protein
MAGRTEHPQMHHPHYPGLRPSGWMNPNFRMHYTLLEPSAMGRVAENNNPMKNSVLSTYNPFMLECSWMLVHSGQENMN